MEISVERQRSIQVFNAVTIPEEKPIQKQPHIKPRIIALIPAHNEEYSIRDCLEGLRDQTMPKDVELDVVVIADNCTDQTEAIAKAAGEDFGLILNVYVTKGNKQRKVGALNSAWKSIYGDALDIFYTELSEQQILYRDSIKAILGMDADSRLAPNAIQHLWEGLMSSRNIGGVMAKYTMRMPKKKKLLSFDDPNYEAKLRSGEYGGPIARWWTHQQKQDMASWLLKLQYGGGSTYVLGGQASLFRPEALLHVVETSKLDGPWQNESDVEDMLLTWQLQNAGWKTLISPEARCYVDAMRNYHSFRQQRNKWQGGALDLLTNRDIGIRTRHTSRMWRDQLKMFSDLMVRVMFFSLLAISIATNQYTWMWIWIIPVVLASLLNITLALKTPMHRPIDVVLAGLLISPEIYLWSNLITFCQVWLDKLKSHKKDGWATQYDAERGRTQSKLKTGLLIVFLCIVIIVLCCAYFRDSLTSASVQSALRPYLVNGWVLLTYLTIFQSFAMLFQIWTLRGKHRA
ncbi:glycosyltransferase family 2 protein [Radiobacillus sp. PE A8.2]|uniref:glycosyltransferase family 2 protein n=1 Tax=Radiobacillus sp. PE A8.2 TaxID=3380349 RepID=UPI0038905704